MQDTHRVRIGRLNTQLRSVGSTVSSELGLADTLSRRLAGALPGLLDPVLQTHHGVIRIKTLSLQLTAQGFSDPLRLADLLAEAITRGVSQALDGHNPPLFSWPRQSNYLAHYLHFRFGLRQLPGWCFEDLASLEQLSPVQALIHLVDDEPEILWELAEEQPLVDLLAQLSGQDCRELLGRLLQPAPSEAILPELTAEELAVQVTELSPEALARHTLKLLFSALRGQSAQHRVTPAQLLPAVLALTALCALIGQQPHPAGDRSSWAQQTLEQLLPLGHRLPPAYAAALRQAAADPVLRQLLQRRLSLREATSQPAAHTPAARRGSPGSDDVAHYVSPWAGCALLLPVLCAHGFDRFLEPAQLHQIVLATLEPREQDAAGVDPLLRRLFNLPLLAPPAPQPTTPQAPWPQVPAELAGQVHPESQALLDPGAAGVPEAGEEQSEALATAWSALLLALFASRLPGLRASTRGYLRRQFLAVPGTLHASATGLHVELTGPDLAVVLSMAGFNGPQQAPSWLGGRSLSLELRGLRP